MRFFSSILIALLFCASAPAFAAPLKLPYSITPYNVTAKDRETLGRVEAYLSSIHSISTDFIQAAPNGTITTGKFYLQRPGKLRMQYNPPTPVLMVTSGSDIVYYDKELDQISRIGLDSTLVGFLARDSVAFDSSVEITRVEYGDKSLRVSLIQTKKPRDGMLTLEFSDNPLTFRNMNVTDSSGQVTTVSFTNARFNLPLPAELFVFQDPHLGETSGIRH
jgi:outer membrane lipoprotein-sorting protein